MLVGLLTACSDNNKNDVSSDEVKNESNENKENLNDEVSNSLDIELEADEFVTDVIVPLLIVRDNESLMEISSEGVIEKGKAISLSDGEESREELFEEAIDFMKEDYMLHRYPTLTEEVDNIVWYRLDTINNVEKDGLDVVEEYYELLSEDSEEAEEFRLTKLNEMKPDVNNWDHRNRMSFVFPVRKTDGNWEVGNIEYSLYRQFGIFEDDSRDRQKEAENARIMINTTEFIEIDEDDFF